MRIKKKCNYMYDLYPLKQINDNKILIIIYTIIDLLS